MITHVLPRRFVVLFAAALLIGTRFVSPASAAEITVMLSGAITPAFNTLKGDFEKKSGHKVIAIGGGSMGTSPSTIPNRLRRGEANDLIIIARPSVEELAKEGLVVPASMQDLVISKIGFAVRKGLPVPDISTPEKLKAVLLKADSIAYSSSASGIYVKNELFKKLGIEKEMAAKKIAEGGGGSIAKGEADMGFQQVSELKAIKEITLVGPIPESLQLITPWTMAVSSKSKSPDAAKELMAFLFSPEATKVIAETGLEPVKAKN